MVGKQTDIFKKFKEIDETYSFQTTLSSLRNTKPCTTRYRVTITNTITTLES